MKKGEKIYDDGLSPELRYYYRNKERILAKKAAERAADPEKFKAQRASRKEKERAQKRKYRSENKEKISGYFAENRERLAAAKKERYERNREQICAEQRARYAANPEPVRAAVKGWASVNREKIQAMGQAWRKANPHKMRLQGSAKRARKRGARGTVSSGIEERLLDLQKRRCACCRCDLGESGYHIDHVVPLALGGMHDDSNLQLLCPSCNMSKHAKHPIDFMQSRGYLL